MRPSFLSLIAVIALVLSVSGPVLRAFPPAPFYTIYGIVRDQVGATLTAQGADLILLRDNVEIARTRILSAVQGDLTWRVATLLFIIAFVCAGLKPMPKVLSSTPDIWIMRISRSRNIGAR
mgnify:CR=1 FL=1